MALSHTDAVDLLGVIQERERGRCVTPSLHQRSTATSPGQIYRQCITAKEKVAHTTHYLMYVNMHDIGFFFLPIMPIFLSYCMLALLDYGKNNNPDYFD